MVIADHHAGDESVPATPKKTPNRVTKKTPKSTKKAENWKSDVSAMLASDDELSSSKKELLKKEVDEALEEF
ncbi:hypothetical protein AAP_00495 [Ascosphaera apis ARSEF 7405]|uniref:Uncharacterized protein n=1 Tax=Ascosphaera apis ARSEF 7405 TaxID=392613 RepID=A0A168DXX8_9EURO|nr:hypothetical protein AAP_00495 [Ascosphaera apis ARSEF 7405]